MKLAGRIDIAAPSRDVWAVATDPTGLATCVPGVQEMRRVDDRTFEGSVSASVGPMNGTFSFRSVIVRQDYPDTLEVSVEGVDSVTRSRLEVTVHASVAEEMPGRTALAYQADVRVKGRLAILGEMILRATANLMIGQVTKCLQTRLEAPPIASETAVR